MDKTNEFTIIFDLMEQSFSSGAVPSKEEMEQIGKISAENEAIREFREICTALGEPNPTIYSTISS